MENSNCTTHRAHWEGGKGREFKDYEACIIYLTALSTCINTICQAGLKRELSISTYEGLCSRASDGALRALSRNWEVSHARLPRHRNFRFLCGAAILLTVSVINTTVV